MTKDAKMTIEQALELVRNVFSRQGVEGNNWVMPEICKEALSVLRAAVEEFDRNCGQVFFENGNLKSENAILKDNLLDAFAVIKKLDEDITKERQARANAEAELERARPLLETVNQARIYWDNKYAPISMSEVSKEAVIFQAIEYAAYREGKGKT